MSKSDLVRKFLAKKPEARNNEVVAAFAKKGVKIASSMVSTLRHESRPNGSIRERRAPKPRAQTIEANSSIANLVTATRNVATQAGGMEKLRELVDALAS